MVVPVYENKSIAEWSFIDEKSIEIRLLNSSNIIEINFFDLENFNSCIIDSDNHYYEFEIISIFEHEKRKYYIYIEHNKVKLTDKFSLDGEKGIPIRIEFTDDRFFSVFENELLVIRDTKSDWKYTVDERIFSNKGSIMDVEMKYRSVVPGIDNPHLFFRITVGNYYAFYENYRVSNKYAMKYLKLKILSNQLPENVRIVPSKFNQLKIGVGDKNFIVNRDEVELSIKQLGNIKKQMLPNPIYFETNGKFFVLSNVNENLLIENANKDDYFIETFSPKCLRFFNKIFCFGRLSYAHDTSTLKLDTVRTGSNYHIANIRCAGNFFFFSIDLNDIERVKNFHNRLWIGNFVHRLKVKQTNSKRLNKIITSYKNNSVFIRLNNLGMLSLTVVPKSKQYEIKNRLKQLIAYYIVRLQKIVFGYKPKVNLYFEKNCSRAEESAIRVFQNIMVKKKLESKNFFILDKKAAYFPELKQKYRKNLVSRFSFKHYYLLFSSTHLISSELSNHVVEVRVLNEKLSKKINSTPLYFLQHGIMFAKPVENPMARGFYKEDMAFTLKKSVISSDLEAREFYKMGYNDLELMKTGLATFDFAVRNKNADKIIYMPTYRYWEEKAVINGQLKETTYFFSIMEVIKAFEKSGLIDRLLITPHNKFSEYILEFMPEYKDIICSNPSEALKQSCVFITDYSSAIYDAIYRGAYPIFYWKDEDYLIQNYQAKPPVNKDNVPGVVAYNEEQLITHVKNAINRNYLIESENLKKYRKINEFHDNKNTERIVQTLLDDGVL